METATRFQVQVRGDSMIRPDGTGFEIGCVVTIDPNRKPRSGDYVLTGLADGELEDRGYLAVYSAGSVEAGVPALLEFLNPRFRPLPVTPDRVILGVVCEKTTREFY
jgi:SOS-response transcriptional repressor LexA